MGGGGQLAALAFFAALVTAVGALLSAGGAAFARAGKPIAAWVALVPPLLLALFLVWLSAIS